MRIKPLEFNNENFGDFGYILSSPAGTPMAENEELIYWGRVTEFGMGSAISTGVLIVNKRPPVLKSFERHLSTPEILVATEGQSVICFAKPGSGGEAKDVKTFLVKQGDAFVMHPGCWHWAGYPVGCDKAKLLVIFAKGTEENDLEIIDLAEEVEIV